MEKNQLVSVRIADIGQDGEGIGHVCGGPDDGFTVFVKDTVPGDLADVRIVKLKKNYAFGRLMRVTEPSADRVPEACPEARRCGGCQLQAMSHEAQLRMKTKKIINDLERIGHFADAASMMSDIMAPEHAFRYRNKAMYPVAEDKNGEPVAGFYAGRTHQVIACADCLLEPEGNADILRIILGWMKKHHIPAYDETTGKGLIRHILIRRGFATGEILVCLVINGNGIPAAKDLISALEKIDGMTGITYCVQTKPTNTIMSDKIGTIWGRPYITDILRSERYGISARYRISPNSFYQVNHEMAEKLYEKVLEDAALTGSETVMDLYCGAGTISLFLASKAKRVIGVEVVPQAVRDARTNAELNGTANAFFYEGKAEEVVPKLYEEEQVHADVVVVDPPRKGCDAALLRTILQMRPGRLVYVSCDPATMARDLRILADGGFRIVNVQPCEQFSQTVHVESIAALERAD